jgi:hypothetical protein
LITYACSLDHLRLQGMVEHYGGELGVLPYPQHGKPGSVQLREPRGAHPSSEPEPEP